MKVNNLSGVKRGAIALLTPDFDKQLHMNLKNIVVRRILIGG
ncbi:hypothetical protein [Clostridium sp.]|nr:hypothetical protein [Clostridium sp.]